MTGIEEMDPTRPDNILNDKARQLCDAGACASMAEARRMVLGGGFDRVMAKVKDRGPDPMDGLVDTLRQHAQDLGGQNVEVTVEPDDLWQPVFECIDRLEETINRNHEELMEHLEEWRINFNEFLERFKKGE